MSRIKDKHGILYLLIVVFIFAVTAIAVAHTRVVIALKFIINNFINIV